MRSKDITITQGKGKDAAAGQEIQEKLLFMKDIKRQTQETAILLILGISKPLICSSKFGHCWSKKYELPSQLVSSLFSYFISC
jgi:hypothetical protein